MGLALFTADSVFSEVRKMKAMQDVIDICAKQKITLSFAESCTGGLVSSTLTESPGVSKIFVGGVVAYSNLMKSKCLGVPEKLLSSFGAVSEEVALAMAKSIRSISESDWASSITGVAGPSGGTELKPVGMVCFSLVGPKFERTYTKHFEGSRKQVQEASMQFVWEQLLEQLGK